MEMHHVTLLLLLLLRPLTSAGLEEADKARVEVIADSSPCSATCGVGVRTQTVCLVEDGAAAMEEDGAKEASQECRVRRARCLESWRCGLSTLSVASGRRVELDCLGEVMAAVGRFSWRVSWRYARGVITSDDSLFSRWRAPLLDRVILDPVREEDAGTYQCVVQDAALRRVKKVSWGIRVLPVGVLDLDYDSSLARWDSSGNRQDQVGRAQQDLTTALQYAGLVVLVIVGALVGRLLLNELI